MRILCISEMWLGSDARGAFMAIRRLGHSIHTIDEDQFALSTWRSLHMRAARKLLRPLLVKELLLEAQRVARVFRPHGLFVFKGGLVHPDVLRVLKAGGVPAVNFYPDVSFTVHGPYLPRALPLYDHVFTTKSWGIADMQNQLGLRSVTFLEHGFDPEIHHPVPLSGQDRARYACDVGFVGTWSPKKEKLLLHLKQAIPDLRLRIWGLQWDRSLAQLASSIVGHELIGEEYSRALCASSICLGLLSEQRPGASSGDLTTSRTFNIPACGAFMLHERNEEVLRYFKADEEAGFFGSPEELVQKVSLYLKDPDRRARIAARGRERCVSSGYSLDDRMRTVTSWFAARVAAKEGASCPLAPAALAQVS